MATRVKHIMLFVPGFPGQSCMNRVLAPGQACFDVELGGFTCGWLIAMKFGERCSAHLPSLQLYNSQTQLSCPLASAYSCCIISSRVTVSSELSHHRPMQWCYTRRVTRIGLQWQPNKGRWVDGNRRLTMEPHVDVLLRHLLHYICAQQNYWVQYRDKRTNDRLACSNPYELRSSLSTCVGLTCSTRLRPTNSVRLGKTREVSHLRYFCRSLYIEKLSESRWEPTFCFRYEGLCIGYRQIEVAGVRNWEHLTDNLVT